MDAPARPLLAKLSRIALAAAAAAACVWAGLGFVETQDRLEAEGYWWRSLAKESLANLRSREVELRKAVRLDPLNAEARYELAELLVTTEIQKSARNDAGSLLPEKLEESRELLDSIETRFPLSGQLLRLRGETAMLQATVASRRDAAARQQLLDGAMDDLERAYDFTPRPPDASNPRLDRANLYNNILRTSIDAGREDLAADVIHRLERGGLRPLIEQAGLRDSVVQTWFVLGAFHQVGSELFVRARSRPGEPMLADRLLAAAELQDNGPIVLSTLGVLETEAPLPRELLELQRRMEQQRDSFRNSPLNYRRESESP